AAVVVTADRHLPQPKPPVVRQADWALGPLPQLLRVHRVRGRVRPNLELVPLLRPPLVADRLPLSGCWAAPCTAEALQHAGEAGGTSLGTPPELGGHRLALRP